MMKTAWLAAAYIMIVVPGMAAAQDSNTDRLASILDGVWDIRDVLDDIMGWLDEIGAAVAAFDVAQNDTVSAIQDARSAQNDTMSVMGAVEAQRGMVRDHADAVAALHVGADTLADDIAVVRAEIDAVRGRIDAIQAALPKPPEWAEPCPPEGAMDNGQPAVLVDGRSTYEDLESGLRYDCHIMWGITHSTPLPRYMYADWEGLPPLRSPQKTLAFTTSDSLFPGLQSSQEHIMCSAPIIIRNMALTPFNQFGTLGDKVYFEWWWQHLNGTTIVSGTYQIGEGPTTMYGEWPLPPLKEVVFVSQGSRGFDVTVQADNPHDVGCWFSS